MTTESKGHETHPGSPGQAPAKTAKTAPAHPLTDKANALVEKIAKADEKHREELAKLRQEATDLYTEVAAENLSPANQLSFSSAQTAIDSGLNYLDPDCIATKPPTAPPPEEKPEEKR